MTEGVGLTPAPGCYRHRHRRDSPWLPVRITVADGRWIVLRAGALVDGSGAEAWEDIPFLVHRWPLTPISEAEYDAMTQAMSAAPASHPLAEPEKPIALRDRPSLF